MVTLCITKSTLQVIVDKQVYSTPLKNLKKLKNHNCFLSIAQSRPISPVLLTLLTPAWHKLLKKEVIRQAEELLKINGMQNGQI